jgi:hypothetical protein
MIRYAVLLIMFALVLFFFALTIELPEVVACIQEKNPATRVTPATRVVVTSARKEGHIVKREFLGCTFFYHTGSVY